MTKEKVSIEKRIIVGLLQGVFFAIAMEMYYYYFDGETFSIGRFLFHGLFFGFLMAIILRSKHKREKN